MDFAVSSLATRGYIREVDPSGSIHLDAAVMHKTSRRSLVASNPRRARMAFVAAASYAVNLRHALNLKEARKDLSQTYSSKCGGLGKFSSRIGQPLSCMSSRKASRLPMNS